MMRKRSPNPRLAKLHRNYTAGEVGKLYGVHKNTVRQWIKDGLQTTDNQRPALILGRDLAKFLDHKRQKNKRTCEPGEIYCVKCREPRTPAIDMADYQPITETQGNLIGICPRCETIIYRRVNLSKIEQVRGPLIVTERRPSDE